MKLATLAAQIASLEAKIKSLAATIPSLTATIPALGTSFPNHFSRSENRSELREIGQIIAWSELSDLSGFERRFERFERLPIPAR